MTQKIIIVMLIIGFAYTGVSPTFAKTEKHLDTQEQLRALEQYLTRTYATDPAPLTNAELQTIITHSVSWIVDSQETNGHFRYEYAPYEDTYLPGDNIVRQAGALYILGEVARRDPDDSLHVQRAMEKSIAYFKNLTREGAFSETDFSCIVEHEEGKTCKLGATSLALIGIISYQEAFPRDAKKYEELALDYTSFIRAMQKENGGFRNLYRINTKTQKDAESPFSNGEALLALARFSKHHDDADTRAASLRTYAYLHTQPYDQNLYLWMMAALKDLQAIAPNTDYATYAKDFTTWRMERGIHFPNTKNYCAYAEGLASSASVVTKKIDPVIHQKIRTELDRRNAYHVQLQLSTVDITRAFLKNNALTFETLEKPDRALGGFLTSEAIPTQRIDFTQHCLGTYLQTLVDLEEKTL